ncbi:MAG: zinc ABC transporter substrate-binding protein [Dongiaceae bacterium]
MTPARRRMLQGIGALAGIVALGAPGRAFAAGGGGAIRAVASIKPIHSLLAGVMAGIGEPALLVQGHASPHSYSLKPSDAALLEEADLVFWVGEPVETFLERPLEALGGRAEVIELLEIDGVSLLASRGGGLWEPHRHEGAAEAEADEAVEAEAHGHGLDGHIWLDPANAKAIVGRMAGALALQDPVHASRYSDNAAALRARIDALDREMATWLAPVRDKPFIVFHDAYQYLEAHFGLNAMGSITVNPEQSPSAERLAQIQAKIAGTGAVCVFAEPQFSEALVRTATEGSTARSGTLDPEATDIPPGPDLYFVLMRNLARSLATCLMK